MVAALPGGHAWLSSDLGANHGTMDRLAVPSSLELKLVLQHSRSWLRSACLLL